MRVRESQELEEGAPFSDRDVRDVAMVCLLGQTVARELFGESSPVGREVYVNDVLLRVLGVLSRKGADIVDEDHDDLAVAPCTTVKFRISAGDGGAAPVDSHPPDPLDLEGRRYPGGHGHQFPTSSPDRDRATPRLHRLSNVDSILVRSISIDDIPVARYPPPVPRRGGRPVRPRRSGRNRRGAHGVGTHPPAGALAHRAVDRHGGRLGLDLGNGRDHLRLLSRVEGLAARPDRRPAL